MTNEQPKYFCVVCGRQLPELPRKDLLEKGAAIQIDNGHLIYVCPTGHSEDEILNAAKGVPQFKKASEMLLRKE